MALNVGAVFHLTRLLLPLLSVGATVGRPSTVVNVGSIAGISPQPPTFPTFAYDASKAAVHHLTRKLAAQLAPGITVNALAPGYVPTNMSKGLESYKSASALLQTIPMGRMGAAADMAAAVIYLASPAAAWVTGIVLPVDGGALLPSKL